MFSFDDVKNFFIFHDTAITPMWCPQLLRLLVQVFVKKLYYLQLFFRIEHLKVKKILLK